jgi:glycosyltransferase involved in cell wall biosynthesis
MTTVGLCMIVKNESPVIIRCLENVRPLVDYMLVVDTGSTDGTQGIVREFLSKEKVPGEVIEEPWRDFAYNRTFALAKLREKPDIDYALVMLLADGKIPENAHDRLRKNAQIAREKLKAQRPEQAKTPKPRRPVQPRGKLGGQLRSASVRLADRSRIRVITCR